jgi:hypothetical protein
VRCTAIAAAAPKSNWLIATRHLHPRSPRVVWRGHQVPAWWVARKLQVKPVPG